MQRHYLSIDIGGTAIKSALIDHSGNIFKTAKTATPTTANAFLAILGQLVRDHPDVRAVCVSVPGIVNHHSGQVKFTGALGFMGEFNLADYLKKIAQLPVYVGNDANCATLAEMWLGNLRGLNSGAVVTLGTSVGGGLMINGQLFMGPHFRAGEISAIVNNHDHADIHESTVGASTSAVKMIKAVATACGLPDVKDGRRDFVEINNHNPRAWDIFAAFCRRVAVLLVNVQAVIDLERVLAGGGISAQPVVVTEIRHQFQLLQAGDRRLHDDIIMPDIQKAKFGNEANLLGALYGLLLQVDKGGFNEQ
ncbi:ROK family protein [Limosilactobacillus panis]|uniref:ROK family protein n=1 Tax=Limosilactobacillus panis TaxID=47493 RepID=UPI00064A65F3|nr:ROK family protein [Limosilactobacillus panis]